jgi:hypothetical protein
MLGRFCQQKYEMLDGYLAIHMAISVIILSRQSQIKHDSPSFHSGFVI